jgi:hypothetical protein
MPKPIIRIRPVKSGSSCTQAEEYFDYPCGFAGYVEIDGEVYCAECFEYFKHEAVFGCSIDYEE